MQNLEFANEQLLTTAPTYAGVNMQVDRKGILFVCEDATMLEVRQMLLERVGYTVWPTKSMAEASAIAEQNCPDMLLIEDGYQNSDLEQAAARVKDVCPQVIAVVLAPYFAVRSSQGFVDCFVARDQGPDLLLAQIEELFQEKQKHDTHAFGSSSGNHAS
jgi:CheY-like chemotaxis protein